MPKTRDYNLSLSQPLKQRIERHRFSGEKNDPLMNRLLGRLQDALAVGVAPAKPKIEEYSPIGEQINFSLPDGLQKLTNKYWQGRSWKNPKRGELQKTLYLLAWWATELEPVVELKSADELLALLPEGRSIAADILDSMSRDRCSKDTFNRFLIQLHDDGLIRLVDVEAGGDAPRRRIKGNIHAGYIDKVIHKDV